MSLYDLAKQYVEEHSDKMITMPGILHKNDMYVRYDIPKNTSGIYFIDIAGTDINAYTGQTGSCIKSRLARHKRSINFPEWTGEKSGQKFHNAGLHDREFVIKYIPAVELGLTTVHERCAAEALFQLVRKPIVYTENSK